MHIKNYILLVLALVFVACSTEKSEGESIVQQPVELVIRASQGGTSRTEMGDVGDGAANSFQTINWAEGDKIKIWAKMTEANASFVINGTTFQLSTFNSTYNSADFKAWAGQMSEGTYNYYGVYPEPESIIGETTVVYTIPSTQSGAYNPALDVMVANTTGRELAYRTDMNPTIGYPEEPRLSFEHLFHLIRIRVPENKLGGAIKFLTIIFPNDVVGKVSFDVSKLTDSNFDITNSQYATWSEMSNKVSIELPDEDLLNANGRYVWLHIKPGALSGNLRMRACSNEGVISQEVVVANFSKTMEAGHITPMALTVPASDETAYKEITFRCPDDEQYPNFLGETATTMYVEEWPAPLKPIASQGTIVESTTGEFKPKFYYLNNDDYKFTSPNLNITMSASFASKNADMRRVPFNGVVISSYDTPVNYALPYLFFEDFSGVLTREYNGVDGWTDGDEVNRTDDMSAVNLLGGWSGSRCDSYERTALRMRTYLATSTASNPDFGDNREARLDTPFLTGIKDNKTVNLGVLFEIAGTVHRKNASGLFGTTGYLMMRTAYKFGTETRSGVIKYDQEITNTIVNTTLAGSDGTYTSNYSVKKVSVPNCTNKHRLSWLGTFDKYKEGSNAVTITAKTLYMYLDNIKVSIGSEAKHTNLNYRDYFPNHTN